MHTPVKHWLPAEQGWPLSNRQAFPIELHVVLGAQLAVLSGIQLVAQLVAFAQAKLLGQGAGVLALQLPEPLQVATAVKIAPEQEADWHTVEAE